MCSIVVTYNACVSCTALHFAIQTLSSDLRLPDLYKAMKGLEGIYFEFRLNLNANLI